jgi:hypothetical protein
MAGGFRDGRLGWEKVKNAGRLPALRDFGPASYCVAQDLLVVSPILLG